MDTKQTADFMN